jgi:hypothetical protein
MEKAEPIKAITTQPQHGMLARVLRWRGWRATDLLPLLGYAMLTGLMTYPLVFHLGGTQVGGRDVDTWMKLWDNWWFEQVVFHGQQPYFTTYLFHPVGADLRFHSISWVVAALSWLFSLALGRVGGYNLVTLLTTFSCGYCAYKLIDHIFHHKTAAWLGGVVFAYFPNGFSASGVWPDFSNLEWIPLLALLLILMLETGKIRYAILSAVVMALATWTSLYIMAIAGLTAGVIVLGWLTAERGWRDRIHLFHIAVFAVLALALFAPRLTPIFGKGAAELENVLESKSEPTNTQVDVAALMTPSLFHGAFYRIPGFSDQVRRYPQNYKQSAYLGVIPLFLAVSSLWLTNKRWLAIWVGCWLLFLILAIGPILRVNGAIFPDIWMPARLVRWVPFIRGIRPAIFVLGLALPMAVLASGGMIVWAERIRTDSQFIRAGLVAGLLAVILFEYWNGRFTLQEASAPAFYQEIAAEPGDFAIIDLPLGRQNSKLYMNYQITHQHPIVEGAPGRLASGQYDYFQNSDLLSAWGKGMPLDCAALSYESSLHQLSDDGFRYIVLHRDYYHNFPDYLPSYFAVPPLYEDDTITVYAVADLLSAPPPC